MVAARFYRVPAVAPLGVGGRVRLVLEILSDYVPSWRRLRRNDLPAMVRAARDVRRHDGLSPDPEREHDLAVRLGAIVVRTLSMLPTDSRCLVRSLVLSRMLARRGIEGVLIIGVQPGKEFAAHAWVEHEGLALLPKGRFERLVEL